MSSDLERLYQEYTETIENIGAQIHKTVDSELLQLHKKQEEVDEAFHKLEERMEAYEKRKLEAKVDEMRLRRLAKREGVVKEGGEGYEEDEEDDEDEGYEMDEEAEEDDEDEGIVESYLKEARVVNEISKAAETPKRIRSPLAVGDSSEDIMLRAFAELHGLSTIVSKKRGESFVS